jgi:hypothetical protein
MSFFDEPFDPHDPRAKELLEVALSGYAHKDPLRNVVSGIGVPENDVNWDGSVSDVWPRILKITAMRNRLRPLVTTLRDDPNYALMQERIVALLDDTAEEEQSERAGRQPGADHTKATVIGRRPFVNRSRLRENLAELFTGDGDRAMIVHGPPASGRSYSWVLIAHVARMTGGPPTRLIDLSRFRGPPATPFDVATMIAADLEWATPEVDETAQDDTKARILLSWLKNRVLEHGAVCLVFDGLDGDNLTDATLNFVGDIAAAAGNDELGESRVILLAYGRTLQNPIVDPFVLREPFLGDIPLPELTAYLRKVAAEGGLDLSEAQAASLAATLLGGSAPDPVPMTLLATRARAVGDMACRLKRGENG